MSYWSITATELHFELVKSTEEENRVLLMGLEPFYGHQNTKYD